MLGKSKLIKKISLLSVLALGLVGCGQEGTTEEISNNYSYNIDGIKRYYADDEPLVQAARELAAVYTEASLTSDYIAGYTGKEYDYYRAADRAAIIADGEIEYQSDYITQYELTVSMNAIEVKDLEFYTSQGEESCNAYVDFVSTIEHATPEYLGNGLKLNTKYLREVIVYLVKEGDEWKVTNCTWGDRKEI